MDVADDQQRRASDPRGTPAAMARYATLGDAREAIETLEANGVDGVDIVLAGWRAQAAERSQRKGRPDGSFVRYMTRNVLRGSLLGGLVGIFVGALVGGIAILAWPGELHSWELVLGLTTGFGAGLGSLVGAFLDVERHVGFSDAWSLTLQDIPDGSIWVLLFDDGDKAREALLHTTPVELRAPQPGE